MIIGYLLLLHWNSIGEKERGSGWASKWLRMEYHHQCTYWMSARSHRIWHQIFDLVSVEYFVIFVVITSPFQLYLNNLDKLPLEGQVMGSHTTCRIEPWSPHHHLLPPRSINSQLFSSCKKVWKPRRFSCNGTMTMHQSTLSISNHKAKADWLQVGETTMSDYGKSILKEKRGRLHISAHWQRYAGEGYNSKANFSSTPKQSMLWDLLQKVCPFRYLQLR